LTKTCDVNANGELQSLRFCPGDISRRLTASTSENDINLGYNSVHSKDLSDNLYKITEPLDSNPRHDNFSCKLTHISASVPNDNSIDMDVGSTHALQLEGVQRKIESDDMQSEE
jgi:hypothetical protein